MFCLCTGGRYDAEPFDLDLSDGQCILDKWNSKAEAKSFPVPQGLNPAKTCFCITIA
jgi:hypothetical protein